MPRGSSNRQLVLKPQDLLVVLKIAVSPRLWTYAGLADELGISASEVHASLKRAQVARLVGGSTGEDMNPIRASVHEFVLHGVKYAFPAILGAPTRGMPTAYAGPSLRVMLTQAAEELPPVWPHSGGTVRGYALYPLYPSVPSASERDPTLYEALALVDAIRIGAARERELAGKMLLEKL
jgi:hypothetical protein